MVIYMQGAYIDSPRPYVKIQYSNRFEVVESDRDNALIIKIPPGFKWSQVADRRIRFIKDTVIKQTDFRKVPDSIYIIGGLKFRKCIPTDYTISQYRLDGISEYVMLWNDIQCQIFIPAKKTFEKDKYLNLFCQNPYLQVIDHSQLKELNNFYGINLGNTSIKIDSTNNYVFKPKGFYDRYILKSIDVQDAFVSALESWLSNVGIELKRRPIDQDAQNVSRVIYSFTDIDKQVSRRSGLSPVDHVVQHSMHVDFELTTPDLAILDDFKHRYSNLDGLTRLTTFETKDSLGNYWRSTVDWQPISTDFTSDYDQDSQGNSAHKANFGADVIYFTVYDHLYYDIQKTVLDLISMQDKFNKVKV